jgi:hypothetical protein
MTTSMQFLVRASIRATSALIAFLYVSASAIGCDTETPTSAVVDDAYPAVPDGGDPTKEITVFKAWWQTTLFLDPVAPGGESLAQRTVPETDYAYAILAPGWDPTSMAPPTTLIPIRSNDKLSVSRGDTLHITVSDVTFTGNCAAGKSLSQADVDFITQNIFPGDFATVTYDAKTCVATPIPVDGGSDGGVVDGGAESAAGDAAHD